MTDQVLILPQIDAEHCAGCGQCVEACPSGALALVEGIAILTRPESCVYCADCEDLCPEGAIGLPYEVQPPAPGTGQD